MSFTLQDISNSITPVVNFPKEGVVFRDISPLLLNNRLFSYAIDLMIKEIKKCNLKPDYIAGFESRGFLFRELANKLYCGFVMIRKPNKMPNCITVEYEKEYGTDKICITNCIPENSNVLLVDDLIATGGTIYCGYQLIKAINCNPIGCIALIELVGLNMNPNFMKLNNCVNFPIISILEYEYNSESTNLIDIPKHNVNNLSVKTYVPLILDQEIIDKFDTIVFCHPSIESLTDNYISSLACARKGIINWDVFPDGKPNITFEPVQQIENKKIVFFLDLYDTSTLFEQLSMLMILPRQFIESLDIYITYFSVGTMERVDKEGILATAETMAKIISNCIETTRRGKPVIHIWDIHALPIRFYFDSNHVVIKLHSGIPLLTDHINNHSIIVFPDDGACKRFKQFFPHYKTIVCSKVREDNTRIIKITNKLNFPKDDNDIDYDEVIIVDDLVQSGGTLIKCKEALEKLGYKKISAYVTHAVFPNEGWNKIIKANFHKFYTTNTIPQVTSKLKEFSCFQIFPIFKNNLNNNKKIIFVASHNEQKLKATYDSLSIYHKVIVKGINVSSDIKEQPMCKTETSTGANNRLKNLYNYFNKNDIKFDVIVAIENGLVQMPDNEYVDICHVVSKSFIFSNNRDNFNSGLHKELSSYDLGININPIIDFKYVDICIRNEQNITIGQVIQDRTGIPKDNWHQYFNGECKLTRIEIIKKTIEKLNI